jgi:hypothetical protein
MQQVRIQFQGPGQGPGKPPGLLARILFSILAVILLVSAAFLGAMFFLAALGVFFVVSIIVAVRLWWARRQIEAAMRRGEAPGQRSGPQGSEPRQRDRDRSSTVIDGEYRVMKEEREDTRGRDGEAQ